MEGEGIIYEAGAPASREEVFEFLDRYGPAVRFFIDWQNKLFTMDLSEYLTMPAVLSVMRNTYTKFMNEVRKEQEKRANAVKR